MVLQRAHLLTILLLGCAAPDPGRTLLIGHGGLGPSGTYPMDSREALFGALESGMHGVELDAQLTGDGVIVAFHDLEVTCGTAFDGPIHGKTWRELQACSGEQNGATLFRLDEGLPAAVQEHPDAAFTLDVKLNTRNDWWTYLRSFAAALKALHETDRLRDRLLVECRTEDFLKLIHEEVPELPLYYYCDEAETGIQKALQLGCSGITIHTDHIDAAQVEEAHAAGLYVTVFGVSGTWGLERALQKNVDRIQLDQ